MNSIGLRDRDGGSTGSLPRLGCHLGVAAFQSAGKRKHPRVSSLFFRVLVSRERMLFRALLDDRCLVGYFPGRLIRVLVTRHFELMIKLIR